MAIKEFEIGKFYRFTGSMKFVARLSPGWCEDMEALLDGKSRKCIKARYEDSDGASLVAFKGIPNAYWYSKDSFKFFEEVDSTSTSTSKEETKIEEVNLFSFDEASFVKKLFEA